MRPVMLLLLFNLLVSPAWAEIPAKANAKARCEVCGMFVAPYPTWLAVLETVDGTLFYFDGPKDLFIFYLNLANYRPEMTPEQVSKLYVTEYYTAQLVPATEVFFVAGSDVQGPMGMELVPVAGRSAAQTFLLDHAGTKLMRFDGHELLEVTESP